MRRLIVILVLPVLFLAQTPRNKANLLPNEQWVSLFNGKDLTGWTKVGNENWTVEDGTIHGQGVTKQYGYLMTEKDYKDFWLSLRFKCEDDGNSGIYFHTRFKPGTVDVSSGMQFEIDRTENRPYGRAVWRRSRVDRVAFAGVRVRDAAQGLERHADEGGGESHGLHFERDHGD